MNPVQFKDQNVVFNKPASMSDAQCGSLPARIHTHDEKFPAVDSVWELSPAELKAIVKSKRIRLTVIAQGMPPVSLAVEQPGNEIPPAPANPGEEQLPAKGKEDEQKKPVIKKDVMTTKK